MAAAIKKFVKGMTYIRVFFKCTIFNKATTLSLLFAAVCTNCTAQNLKVVNLDDATIEDRATILASYQSSDSVIHGIIKSKEVIKSKDKLCKIEITNVKVIESFKGPQKAGQFIKLVFVGGRFSDKSNSEQLFFLSSYKDVYPMDFKKCDLSSYEGALSVNNSCCTIKGKDPMYLVMNHEETSNDMSEFYLVDANRIFEKFRAQEK